MRPISEGRKNVKVARKNVVFSQGDVADAVFYIKKGKVRLTVVSEAGKEVTIAILSEGNFFGEVHWVSSLTHGIGTCHDG